ncbi:MAG: PEP/pyruvate-binding domain-containing protein, partial [Chloroflexota bacterium]
MNESLVVPLSALGAGDLGVAGGKGANLGELIRAGFAVPDGFVITTGAYAAAARAAGVDPSDTVDARRRLTQAPVPPHVAAAVRDAYRALGGGRVAVRSSATAEDLPEASFAGQQDTILDVEGEDALEDAVRRCWASLWNERAVSYRASHTVDETALRLAVVVQRMVAAKVAGVLFTADPMTGRRRRAAIDAVRGLGEQLVSGAVNPDHYLVDTAGGTILERRGDSLDDTQLRELANVGASIEAHFGRPQDIEWAIDDKLWIVQSRDITTLYPLPPNAPDPDRDLRVYFSANVAQGVMEPFTPMGLQTFRLIGAALASMVGRPVADPVVGTSVTVDAGMRLWIDLTGVLRNASAREVPVRVMSVMEARSSSIFARLLEDPRLAPRGGSRLRSAVRVLRAVAHTGAPPVLLRALRSPDVTRERLLREVDALVTADLGPLTTPAERLDAFERLILTRLPRMFPKLVAMVAAGFLSYNVASRLLRGVAADDEMRTVLRGLPFNPTTEMDLELWAIARRTSDDPQSRAALAERSPADLSADFRRGALPAALQRDLEAFLSRYGHRAIAEIDLGVPRWAEDPTHLLGAVANYQRLDAAALAPDAQFARGAREAEATIASLLSRVHGPRRVLARAFLRRVRALAGVREAPKFHAVRV